MSTAPAPPSTQLSTAEAWALARGSTTGRLAVVVDGAPDIFPVSHVVDHGTVVFRTAAGTKFSAASGRPVAFEVDGYDVDDGSAWSVVVKGRAHEIRELGEIIDALELPLTPWHHGPKPRFVRIEPDSVTGVRLPAPTGDDGPTGDEGGSRR